MKQILTVLVVFLTFSLNQEAKAQQTYSGDPIGTFWQIAGTPDQDSLQLFDLSIEIPNDKVASYAEIQVFVTDPDDNYYSVLWTGNNPGSYFGLYSLRIKVGYRYSADYYVEYTNGDFEFVTTSGYVQ